jgi:hypothetical protein
MICALAAGGAYANSALNAGEARALLFGMDLRGVHEPTGLAWRECIDARGATLYWFGSETPDRGKLRIREDGAACFSYASENYADEACWFATRVARNQIRFESVDGGGTAFVTTSMRRVRTCQGGEVPVS